MKITASLVLLAVAAIAPAAHGAPKKPGKVRVLLWSEQTEPRDVYPTGISGALAEHLAAQKGLEARTAELSQPEAGLSEAALAETDVLVWFGHKKHGDVPDDAVDRVVRHIRERGMGFVALHSAHFSKPLKKALNATGAWSSYRNLKQELKVWVVAPSHPIARGVKDFTIPQEEIYTEPFEVPPPEAVILEGTWPSGHRTREGLVWTLDKGRFVYFRMGHEEFPIFHQPEMKTLVTNAVLWAAKKTHAPKKLARREAGPKATAEGPLPSDPPAIVPDEKIALFNGKDLTGWKADVPAKDTDPNAPDSFIVRGGMLVSLGKPGGHLVTEARYRDYRLEVEYRFPGQGGNCGVLVHASRPRALYKMFPQSIEVQMMHENAGDFWCIEENIEVPDMEKRRPRKEGQKFGGGPADARRILNLTDGSEKPLGQWNTMVIEARGRTLKVWVNGALVNDGFNATVDRGKIALQAEGTEVEFRRVELMPLPAAK